MDTGPIDSYLRAPQARRELDMLALRSRIVSRCWPGGAADRTEPTARGWVARWRPARSAAPLPQCACASGPCPVCN